MFLDTYLNAGAQMPWFLFTALLIWSMIWKGLGLWKAGRNKQLTWFIVIFLVNSAGILPIVYILWFQKNKSVMIIPKIKETIAKIKKKKKK